MSTESIPRIMVHPEPTLEELAAIVAAVTTALREGTRALPYESDADQTRPSRWASQGRLEAMRGLDDDGIDRRQILAGGP